MTSRKAQQRRLERAGYQHVAGWLPIEDARKVSRLIEDNRERAEDIAASPPLPVGRPRKETTE